MLDALSPVAAVGGSSRLRLLGLAAPGLWDRGSNHVPRAARRTLKHRKPNHTAGRITQSSRTSTTSRSAVFLERHRPSLAFLTLPEPVRLSSTLPALQCFLRVAWPACGWRAPPYRPEVGLRVTCCVNLPPCLTRKLLLLL